MASSVAIAIVLRSNPSADSTDGVSKKIYRFAETLGQMGHRVLVVSLIDESPNPIPGVEVWAYSPHRDPFRHMRELEARLTAWSPDVVVVPSVYTPPVIPLLRHLAKIGIPYVIGPSGGYGFHNERKHWIRKRIYKYLFELPALNRAAFIWSQGDSADIKAYGVTRRIVETRKGLDKPKPSSEMSNAPSDSRFAFGFLGRLDPFHKGLDLAIKGFAKAQLPSVSMMLVGPGDERGRKRLLRLSSQAGVSHAVQILPPLIGTERDSYLAGLDVFFHISRWEGGIPYSIIEAAALARPLLISRRADSNGQFATADAAVYVDLDPESVAEGMKRLYAMSGAERRSLGEKAYQVVTSAFGWEGMAGDFLAGLASQGIGVV